MWMATNWRLLIKISKRQLLANVSYVIFEQNEPQIGALD